ncbi:MAG: helix-turn-helix domain-containing protein [Oscillospiraceae bacterium]|nr:helix-turn-helix domain-containing protein [Oscillospiraceae bacterium]
MKSTGDLIDVLKSKESYTEARDLMPAFLDFTLAEHLAQIIAEKQLKKSEIIDKSGIERTYAYQIMNGTKMPSRDKLLALLFGMQLSFEEAQTLLKVSGYAQLYAKNKRDNVIIFSLDKHHSILDVNETLFSMNEAIIE